MFGQNGPRSTNTRGIVLYFPKGQELDLAWSTTVLGLCVRNRASLGCITTGVSEACSAVEIGKPGPHPRNSGRSSPKGYASVGALPSTMYSETRTDVACFGAKVPRPYVVFAFVKSNSEYFNRSLTSTW